MAIKLLPAEVAGDAERLARFEREARLLAALNHPGIAHVYGFESAILADGSAAYGPTCASRRCLRGWGCLPRAGLRRVRIRRH